MKETADDLMALQRLLDDSYEGAGAHLRSVITPDRRLSAADIAARLEGVSLLVLATSSAAGAPITGPVDGIFYRGAFHFGSSPDSVRFRHIRRRPAVSATHLPGEEICVTVHGTAAMIDLHAGENAGFVETLLGIYVPRYGEEWARMLEGDPSYARIAADRMFTFDGEGL